MSESPNPGRFSFLLICHSYPPIIGGSELEAQRVCEALIRRGNRVTVVCAGGDPMPPLRDWIDPKGIPVRLYAGRWNGRMKDIVFALRVAWMLFQERRNYQFVYFLMQGLHLLAGLPVARFLGKPIVMKVAGSGVIPEMRKSRAGRQELLWLREWARCLMILNEGMRQEAIDSGFPPHQLLWMPNPVDTDEFSPASESDRQLLRSQLGLPLTAPVVLYCGRLAPEKALPSLLAAFSTLVQEIPESILVLVGDGPLLSALQKQAEELRLSGSNILFAGRVDPGQVRLWLKAADIFVLVSHSEGFPCALIEAMSVGLPSVSSDIPANQQLIKDGEHGFLVPAGNSSAIAEALNRLVRDSELRGRMGKAARSCIVENYSSNRIADLYESLFERIIQQ
jgi:glycosyltransferase involved in cell wall biosynthesis